MNAPVVRIRAEQLLFREALRRPSAVSAVGCAQASSRASFSSLQPQRTPRAVFQRNPLHLLRNERATFASRFRPLRFKSDKARQTPNPTPHLGSPEPAPSLSQRLKRLSKEYGWLAVGVYLALSALDFPFCFLAVRMLGTERVGHYEHVMVEGVKSMIRIPFPGLFKGAENPEGSLADDIKEVAAGEDALDHDGAYAVGQNGGAEASLWTQLALAYAVHKSLIFFRIPLTAAVLPKVAKTLRQWGWNIGKPRPT